MERLWAPWRLTYVKSGDYIPVPEDDASSPVPAHPEGCIFCYKPRQDDDAANLIVARGETVFAILNAYPYNNGHLMIVPYRHISHPKELTDAENAELMQAAAAMTGTLDTVYRPDGYNIGMNVGSAAGAGIAAHLHLHIVPRWSGDTNFMPVIADVKVLPEMLADAFVKIRDVADAAAKKIERNEA